MALPADDHRPNFLALEAEVLTDPLSLSYSAMSDAAVVTSLKGVTRPLEGDAVALRESVLSNVKRSNRGNDIDAYSVMSRLAYYAENGVDGADVFDAGAPSNFATIKRIAQAKGLFALLNWSNDSLNAFLFDATSSPWLDEMLQDLVDAKVMGQPDKDAIIGVTNNQQSRIDELSTFPVGIVTAANIAYVRT